MPEDPLALRQKQAQIAVIGGSNATETELYNAGLVGTLIAHKNAVLLSGGGCGVMEASCKGATDAGGLAVGIVPDRRGNQYLTIIIRTQMNHARNVILVGSADAVIAIGGEYGTLSEIAFALKSGIPVFGLGTWEINGVHRCFSPEDAVTKAFDYIGRK